MKRNEAVRESVQSSSNGPDRLGSFVVLMIATAFMAVCAGVSAHLAFIAIRSTGFGALARYEPTVQQFILALFVTGIIAASLVRLVRIDIDLLKRDAQPRSRTRAAPSLSLRGDGIVGRGVH